MKQQLPLAQVEALQFEWEQQNNRNLQQAAVNLMATWASEAMKRYHGHMLTPATIAEIHAALDRVSEEWRDYYAQFNPAFRNSLYRCFASTDPRASTVGIILSAKMIDLAEGKDPVVIYDAACPAVIHGYVRPHR